MLFLGSESSSFLDAEVPLVMHNSLDILPAIKHLRPDPGLGRLLPERISRIELTKGGRAFCRQEIGVERPLVTAGEKTRVF